MSGNPTALQRFDELCNDYIEAKRMAIRAEINGTNQQTPYDNTIAIVTDEIAEFVMVHLDTFRKALATSRDKERN